MTLTEMREAALWQLLVAPSNRGMAELEQYVLPAPFTLAARALLGSEGSVIIGTGFPVNGHPETDGPPAAIALCDALTQLDRHASLASWAEANAIFRQAAPDLAFIDVPVTETPVNTGHTDAVLVMIEVCGKAEDNTYRNMRHKDVSASTPKFEAMFGTHALIGIGDGGNEFGMGNAGQQFMDRWELVRPLSTCDHLLPGNASNYGGYGLIRAMEWETGQTLLPDATAHASLIEQLVRLGCVDGLSGKHEPKVDSFALSETIRVIEALKAID